MLINRDELSRKVLEGEITSKRKDRPTFSAGRLWAMVVNG